MPTLREKLETQKFRVQLSTRVKEAYQPLWEDTLAFFRSDPPTSYPPDWWKLQVNFVFSWFESIWPSLTFNHPHFTATPLSETSVESSKATEAAINGELRRIGFRDRYNPAVFDFLLAGVGILHLGFYADGLVPEQGRTDEDETTEGIGEGTRGNSDAPYGFEENSLYVRKVSPWDFFIDPEACSIDDARWCGYKYLRPIELVKKDPQYRFTKDLVADSNSLPNRFGSPDNPKTFRETFGHDPVDDQVCLYQIWDIVDRKVYTFSAQSEKFHSIRPWLPVKRFPFYPLHATQDNYEFWNQSPVVPWLSLVNEMNLTVSNRVDHLSRNTTKWVYDKVLIDDKEMEALTSNRHAVLVGVNAGERGDVRSAISPVTPAQLPPEHWAHTAEIRQRLTEISGQSEFDVGGTRPGERPAREIDRISAGADNKRFGLASRLLRPCSSFAHDFRRMMQSFYSEERVVQVTDEFGESEWVRYDGNTVGGEYSFMLDLEELSPETMQQRQQKAGMVLQLLTPYSQVASPIPRIDIDPLLRKIGDELRITPFLKFFPSVAPPMDPGQEWFLIVEKGQDLEPNDQDAHDFHLFTHIQQLDHPLTNRDPAARERLKTHIERHESKKIAFDMMLEAQQKTQGQGGAPGPSPGTASNNSSGGAGPFSGANGGVTQGGAGVGNIQSLLRGGV